MVLTTIARDGSGAAQVVRALDVSPYDYPRWSPDDRWIAFHRGLTDAFADAILMAPAGGGEPRVVVKSESMRGICWLPDGSGFVYSSSRGSTVLYPPIFNLRTIRLDGSGERQLTFGDVSYKEPEIHSSGKLLASRIRMHSDIWRFPATGSPAENTRTAMQITRQTAQVQAPSVSPDGSTWCICPTVAATAISGWPIPTEPESGNYVRARSYGDHGCSRVVSGGRSDRLHSDAAGQYRRVVDPSRWQWFAFARKSSLWFVLVRRWTLVYYSPFFNGDFCIEKIRSPAAPWFACDVSLRSWPPAWRRTPRSTSSPTCPEAIAWGTTRSAKRFPKPVRASLWAVWPVPEFLDHRALFQPTLSPDGRWLAMSLLTGATTNLWLQPTAGGPMRQVTDYGQRSILMVRRVSWSPDSKSIYAAVAETDADVVLLDGLVP